MSSPIFVEDEVVRKAHSLKFEENLEASEKLRKWLEGLSARGLRQVQDVGSVGSRGLSST